jgi:hypothetical protein
MFKYTKIALSLALVLGAASAATAAPKHRVHHRAPIERILSGAAAYGAFARSGTGHVDPALTSPALFSAQKREAAGDPRCWGGNCDPLWGDDY